VFFAWGEIYSLFPAVCTDLYGTRYATTNAGLLYTAKGTAALLVPVASQIHQMTGSWTAVFFAASLFNLIASVLALLVLKRVRKHGCIRRPYADLLPLKSDPLARCQPTGTS
jgi:OFA family oxalate/formate antiporter-like MFS transporter